MHIFLILFTKGKIMKLIKLGLLLSVAALLLAGCVSKQKYNTLEEDYQQLNQSMSAKSVRRRCKFRDCRIPSRFRSTASCCSLRAGGRCRPRRKRPSPSSRRSWRRNRRRRSGERLHGQHADRPGFEGPGRHDPTSPCRRNVLTT